MREGTAVKMMHKGRLVLSRNTIGNNTAISQDRLTLNRDDSSVTKLCDLHVYRVPHELWRDSFNNILNNSVTETISIGIIRVPSELRLVDIRDEIVQQLQLDDLLPRDFVFLRSVGRSLTTLRGKQEFDLKAKHFLPPVAVCPELYILEVTPEVRDALAISDGSSQSPISRRMSPSHRAYNNSYRNGYPDKGSNRRHDDDSGVAELSPDDEYNRRLRDDGRESRKPPHHLNSSTFALDDATEAERRRRLEDIENQNELDRQRWNDDEEERRRHAEQDRRRAEEEKRDKEELERQNREREERRQKEEEEEKAKRENEQRRLYEKEEEEKRQKEEKENEKNKYKDDVARFPSPPPLQMSSPEPDLQQNSEEAKRQRREEKERLLREIEEARAERQIQEREREECVKKAKTMQHKTTNRRNEARDLWKKKYFEEKKKTAPLEENSNRLRQELEALHRRLMNTLEGPKDRNMKAIDAKPSEKNNYVIQCTKLHHEIEDLKRRAEHAKMKLTAEMKLRNQAEGELRALRAELTQKMTNMTMARQQQYAALNPRSKEPVLPPQHKSNDRSRMSDTSTYPASESSHVLRAF